jgi:transcriptional regulator with XRE-family HTH domain
MEKYKIQKRELFIRHLKVQNKNRIRQIRQFRGYTRAQLANLIDVPPPTLANWELNKFAIGIFQLRKIAAVLDCTEDFLVENEILFYQRKDDYL